MRIGVTGHQRLPAQVEQFVLDDLARYAGLCDLWCVSSLAAGADQLAAARLLHLGARLHVVVPCEGYESTFTEGRSRRRYGDLVSAATVVDTLAYSQPGEDAFLAAGMAVVDLSEEVLAVWDGLPSRGRGGTADVVAHARTSGTPVRILWPAGAARD